MDEKLSNNNQYKLDLQHYDKFCILSDVGIILYDEEGKEISKKK